MKWKSVIVAIVTVFISLFIFSIPPVSSSALSAEPEPLPLEGQVIEDQIKVAILEAIALNENYAKGGMATNLQVTDLLVSQDQQWSTAWVVYYDPQIEALIPTEPGLAIAHSLSGQWQVFLCSDPGWKEAINSIPVDLFSPDEKDMWVAMNQGAVEAVPTQSGYLLPWHGGQTANLSRSVGHDADFSTG